jgi:hypothetical protein
MYFPEVLLLLLEGKEMLERPLLGILLGISCRDSYQMQWPI